MSYTLLALDMDGTLLDSNKQVSKKTAEALKDLSARGIAIAYCSGRCRKELLDFPEELPFIRYGVLSSGGLVYDFEKDLAVEKRSVDTETIIEAIGIARQEDVMVHLLAVSDSIVRQVDMDNMERYGMGIYRPMYEAVATVADDPVEWVKVHPAEVLKFNFYHLDPDARDRTRERIMEAKLPLTLANAEVTSLECSPLGVSKATGLSRLAEYVGCTLDEVVAVGDSDNDLQALGVVGMPVAMGNATEAVRKVCRMVVADNDHDGIVEAIKRLF